MCGETPISGAEAVANMQLVPDVLAVAVAAVVRAVAAGVWATATGVWAVAADGDAVAQHAAEVTQAPPDCDCLIPCKPRPNKDPVALPMDSLAMTGVCTLLSSAARTPVDLAPADMGSWEPQVTQFPSPGKFEVRLSCAGGDVLGLIFGSSGAASCPEDAI